MILKKHFTIYMRWQMKQEQPCEQGSFGLDQRKELGSARSH